LASQTSDKAGLGYNSKVFTQAMFDCDKYYSSESDTDSWSPSNLYDRFVPSGGYHVVPPPMTGTFMPPKPDLVFYTPPSDENEHLAFNVQLSPTKTEQDLPSTLSASIIEDWVFDSGEEDIPHVPKDVPSLAQSPKLVKTPRHFGLISPPPMSVAPLVLLRLHSSSKGLKRPKKTCFVCKSETHLIKDCDFHARKLAQTSCAPRDFHNHNAPMKHSRIPLHKVSAATPKSKPVLSAAARTVGAARPTFSKTRPHIAPYTVSKSKAPIRRPFIRHTTPTPRLSPPRVNTANPSTVSVARVKAARPSAVSAARVKAARPSAVSVAHINVVKPSAFIAVQHTHTKKGNPQQGLKDKGVIDSGCSRHMTRIISYLSNFEELNGGYVAFGGNPKGGKIMGKGKIKSGKLDFDDVYYVKELKFNLFSVSQIEVKASEDKPQIVRNNSGPLIIEDWILDSKDKAELRPKIKKKMVRPSFAKIEFVKSKEQVKTLRKTKAKQIIKKLMEDMLLLELTPKEGKSLAKDETSGILKSFITRIENLVDLKVKVTRCDKGTEFKNRDMNQFCEIKGQARKEKEPGKDYILLPLWTVDPPFPQEPKSSQDVGFKPSNDVGKKVNEVPRQENESKNQEEKDSVNSTNRVNAVSSTVNAASNEVNVVSRKLGIELFDDPNMPELEDINIFEDSNEDVLV
nr:ribonuclease H-like domain-containing protein [Tanacetum cinerariifolium]